MHYILMSSTCSKKKYDEVYITRTRPMLDSSQKFFRSLVIGLSNISTVSAISELPVSHSCYKKVFVKKDKDIDNNIDFHYAGFINFPVIKTLSVFFQAKRTLNILAKRHNEDIIILCDALSLSMTLAALTCKRKNVKKVCIATDIPMMSVFKINNIIKKVLYKIYNTLTQIFVEKFDAYVVLVDKMNSVINPHNKPSMVLECVLSADQLERKDRTDGLEYAKDHPIIMYAGKLHSEFGIDLLAKAINMVKHDCVLDLYGEGNYKEVLKDKSKRNDRIHVHDAVTVDEVIRLEENSAVLVNPRTSVGEFTKYSFPSKTVEYMMTGVPVVMFKLPGIPSEYSDFLNYAEAEDEYSLASTIDNVLGNYTVAKAKAIAGKQFVIREKNHLSQAAKLHSFLTGIFIGE